MGGLIHWECYQPPFQSQPTFTDGIWAKDGTGIPDSYWSAPDAAPIAHVVHQLTELKMPYCYLKKSIIQESTQTAGHTTYIMPKKPNELQRNPIIMQTDINLTNSSNSLDQTQLGAKGVMNNTDFGYGNYKLDGNNDQDAQRSDATTLADCYTACVEDDLCKRITFKDNTCWLKGKPFDPFQNPNFIANKYIPKSLVDERPDLLGPDRYNGYISMNVKEDLYGNTIHPEQLTYPTNSVMYNLMSGFDIEKENSQTECVRPLHPLNENEWSDSCSPT